MTGKKNKYIAYGVMLLIVLVIVVIFYTVMTNLSGTFSLRDFINSIASILYGVAFAYLMNPVVRKVEAFVQRVFAKSNMTERGLKKLSRAVGIVAGLIVFLLVVYAIIAAVVPQVISSLEEVLNPQKIEGYYEKIDEWTSRIIKDTAIEGWVNENGGNFLKSVQDWLTKEVDIATTISNAAGQVINIVKGVFNAVIGIVVAIYILASKDKFQAQAKKITVAALSRKHADRALELARRTNRIFGGFIVGKIIDSMIIAVICYIGMLILNIPYPMLNAVVVGFTNIVPFFGPLVGGIITVVLVLLQDPLKALYTAIFVIVLQQVDGNLIGPRILGEKLGISDFWILVSIMVFGGLFGFAGMLLGVPLFALIYSLVNDWTSDALRKKRQPLQTGCYYSILAVDDLAKYKKDFGEPTVVYSTDTFDYEYDPDDDFEIDDADE